jgi:hypothetical protein
VKANANAKAKEKAKANAKAKAKAKAKEGFLRSNLFKVCRFFSQGFAEKVLCKLYE